ncbi:MAG: four-carbon acid sugar kinase family protein [Gemmobacter sp.]
MTLPPGLLIGFYGDDFTGSTDVMEVLAFAGLPTVLFLGPPAPDDLARFPGLRAVGIAGTARAQSPDWMAAHLPTALGALAALRPALMQYKVCSTFDSAPHVGSIGRALEIGLAATGAPWASMLVAAPSLRRYQIFGTLFAAVDGVGYRLDRHPTMARHPVTPMDEADLRRHLAAQTALPVGLVDFLALSHDSGQTALAAALDEGARAVLIDTLDAATLEAAGALIWRNRTKSGFSVSSSGLEYALVAHWRTAGWLAPPMPAPRLAAADPLFVVCGSCSPATAAQIGWAEAQGWACLRADPAALLDDQGPAVESCCAALSAGRSTVLYAARGPDDTAIAAFEGRLGAEGRHALGAALGAVARAVLDRARLSRLVVAGGDTSGAVARALGLVALTAAAPVAPGSPLCHAHGADTRLDGLTIALKGGQVGGPDYFGLCRQGGC